MPFDLFDIACDQRAEVRTLASTYVARYGGDALPLARMARTDVLERGRHARAALYDQVIHLLRLRDRKKCDARVKPLKMRMTISDTMEVPPTQKRLDNRQSLQRSLQVIPV
ncbi:hypothetical protein [Sphingomonas sp. Mn802worker]|uniref:hypothetical protein n=1 Tax=Sphingomonas sp. Mn802worker TaxID=629773 RepID=UPI000379F1E2|nr:hypothetical protein [Sphingomonas sp. Mn802worker]